MKGPGMRLDLDVRRIWECPECHRQIKAEGQVVSRVCGCTKEGVGMRLIELPRTKPTVRLPEAPTPDAEEDQLSDFPTDIPIHPPVKRLPTPEPDVPAIEWIRQPEANEEKPEPPTS